MSGRDEHARRRPVQARSTATVQAVLDAARAVLNAGDELTARSIAERAGIAAPTVYRYFADVKAVVDALVGEGDLLRRARHLRWILGARNARFG